MFLGKDLKAKRKSIVMARNGRVVTTSWNPNLRTKWGDLLEARKNLLPPVPRGRSGWSAMEYDPFMELDKVVQDGEEYFY